MSDPLIVVEDLRKTYRQGFWMREVEAVRGVSFSVDSGEAFGFLGPNGAGKTTTIKMLMGLIGATSGEARLFGRVVPHHSTRLQVGYLPENPYIYPYLTPREFIHLCGRLSGLRGAGLRDRCRAVLKQTGIEYAADRQTRRLSKGMLQRAGLAAALVADPQLLVLDEPMSGLDPAGRREVRDIIRHEGSEGRTIFFSTHILSDVPLICERIAILQKGEVVVAGRLEQLLRSEATAVEVLVDDPGGSAGELKAQWAAKQWVARREGTRLHLGLPSPEQVGPVLREALAANLTIVHVEPRYETLEHLFLRKALTSVAQELPVSGAHHR